MSKNSPNRYLYIAFVLVAVVIGGCSTQKNTSVSRAYHNLTSRYNYFFNAKESFNNGIKQAEESFNYNYTFPLPVLLFGKPQVVSMVGGDMDRAITKCTDMISHHSITVKPERKRGLQSRKEREFYNQNEFVRWVREGWLLVGKARAWKGSYDEARMTFEYNLVQFPETPIFFESQIWLARIDILDGDLVAAEDRLRGVTSNRRYPKNKYFKHLLESTQAYFYQKQENIPQTIKHLERALDSAPRKSLKNRYLYLLAQLYQAEGKLTESNRYFQKVIKANPSYEMSFNARVNIASNFQGRGSGNDMVRELNKMAKDEKNAEYLDQIYFALGNIERARNNEEKAIEYYQLSAMKSINNNHQKGLSYLILADYFFEKPNYTQSQAYYDSAYRALDQDFPGYKELEIKTQNLNQLVENLNIVSREDSLQKVAAMSPRERDAIIANLIKLVRDEEEKLKQEEREGRDRFAHFQQTQRGRVQTDQGGKWYFYNQSSLSYGLSEFQMRWGRRKLEDNWRRSNKREVLDQAVAETQPTADTSAVPSKVLDNKSREYYLQDLPLTDSLIEISHQQIQEALFKVGEIYENELNDYPEAIKAYEMLAQRYPKSSFTLLAYYNLYQIARFNQQPNQMERYKQSLISQFPNSTYALMLSDPNYLVNLKKESQVREEYYQNTFNLYQNGNCAQATQMAKDGLDKYPDSDIAPKFQYIIAQCTGQTGNIRAYRFELNRLIEQYPQSEVAQSATKVIAMLDQRELQLASASADDTTQIQPGKSDAVPEVGYKEPKGEHLFIAIVPVNSPINQLRFNMVSFNVDNFIDFNLNVTSSELTEFVVLIKVESFKDQQEAKDYFMKVSAEQGLMGSLSESDYSFALISRENLEIFQNDKSVAGYLNFFRENYLK
jgi:tetratricopeptide (TPR) repeat protein